MAEQSLMKTHTNPGYEIPGFGHILFTGIFFPIDIFSDTHVGKAADKKLNHLAIAKSSLITNVDLF